MYQKKPIKSCRVDWLRLDICFPGILAVAVLTVFLYAKMNLKSKMPDIRVLRFLRGSSVPIFARWAGLSFSFLSETQYV